MLRVSHQPGRGIYRACGRDEANAFWQESQQRPIPVTIVEASQDRVLQAARLKAHYPISLTDAFAVQLAQEMETVLVTGDPEIRALEKDQIVEVA